MSESAQLTSAEIPVGWIRWTRVGEVSVDHGGHLVFPSVQPVPGIYRFTISDGPETVAEYIGQAAVSLVTRFGLYRSRGKKPSLPLASKTTCVRSCDAPCPASSLHPGRAGFREPRAGADVAQCPLPNCPSMTGSVITIPWSPGVSANRWRAAGSAGRRVASSERGRGDWLIRAAGPAGRHG